MSEPNKSSILKILDAIEAPSRKNDKPLYAQLTESIKLAIVENNLQPGDRIPSEHELLERFGVSRITVRLATQGLEHEGVITRVRGRGSFVAEPKLLQKTQKTEALGSRFYREGEKVTNHLIEKTLGFAASMYTEAINLPAGSQVLKVRRLKKIGDSILGLETRIFPLQIAERFSDEELSKEPFIDILSKWQDTKIAKVRYWITSASISDMEADLLGIQPELPVLVQHGAFINESGQPVMTGRIVYPADKMEIHYDYNSPGSEGGDRNLI